MKKTIRDIQDWQGKRALVRVDFNVPINEKGEIADDTRMQESLPTLKCLVQQGARVILLSHLGRPKGKPSREFSLEPVARHLQFILPEAQVAFCDEVVGSKAEKSIEQLKPGEVLLLENVRFEPGEEANDSALAQKLASYGDVYVNDAFGSAHRAHASTEGVAHYLSPKVAGFLMEKEIKAMASVLECNERFTAIIGGSKISTKITVLENLLPKVGNLVIGGAMMFTFLRAEGFLTGTSLVEEDHIGTARKLIEMARTMDVNLVIPVDVLVAERFNPEAETKIVDSHEIPDGWMGVDIGTRAVIQIQEVLASSPMVLWNGPLGVFEVPKFAGGTRAIASTVAELTEQGKCKSILGGGDTVAAIEMYNYDPKRFTHVSTGGGASLEYLEGKTLPGIAILDDATVGSRA